MSIAWSLERRGCSFLGVYAGFDELDKQSSQRSLHEL